MESINLNNEERKGLWKKIVKILKETYLRPLGFVAKLAAVDDILKPLTRENSDNILKYYNKRDIWWLFFEFSNFATADREIEVEKLDLGTRLSDFLTQKKLNSLAKDIFVNLTMPKTYHIFVNLPNADIGRSNIVSINDTYSFIRATESVMKKYKARVSGPTKRSFRWKKNKIYLLIKHQGFFLYIRHTLSFTSMISKLKSFLGMSLIQEIFEQSLRTILSPLHELPDPISIPIFEAIEEMERLFGHYSTCTLSENMSELITHLEISDFAVKPSDDLEAKRLKGKSQSKFIEDKFKRFIRPVLDSKDEDAERIKASCEWYFESLCTDNPTFRFVQSHIAIESLLGKPGIKVSITKGLAERIAFLLGNNIKEREEIRDEYEKLYDVRSDIIHRSKISLSDKELSDLEKTEEKLVQLVKKEIQNYSNARLSEKRGKGNS